MEFSITATYVHTLDVFKCNIDKSEIDAGMKCVSQANFMTEPISNNKGNNY